MDGTKIELAKMVVRIFSSFGVGTVVKNIVTATTPAGLKLGGKIMVSVGEFIIAGMIMGASDHYVENRLDAIHMAYMIYRQQKEKDKEEDPTAE